jgi:hypothetical protein
MVMGRNKYSIAPCCGNLWWIGTDFGGKSGMEGGKNSLEYGALIGASLHLGAHLLLRIYLALQSNSCVNSI